MKCSRDSDKGAFVLLEVMIGVAIFAIGVLALGKCVENCVAAEGIRLETERATQALENRMNEIEGGAISTEKNLTVDLGETYPGMTLKQSRHPVTAQNEKKEQINGLYEVDLELDWKNGNEPQSRAISFYVLRTR